MTPIDALHQFFGFESFRGSQAAIIDRVLGGEHALVIMPDHLHAIWTLPEGDSDFSSRWAVVKRKFVAQLPNVSASPWQSRFWEHRIRNDVDFARHVDYIHYNPIKHNLCACAHAWPHSTFSRWVESGGYERSWQCGCDGRRPIAPNFDAMGELELE